ncbi:MAG: UbiA family prenyltransferase [Solirubrobacteraceae bacterium]
MIRTANPSILAEWARLARWREWVQSKLPFMAAVTVLLAPPSTPTVRVAAIVATVMAGAAFGYGLNEVADRASDARAGKDNRAAGLAPWRWALFLVVTAAGALGLSLVWAPDGVAPALVVLGLSLAVLYSVRPFRLKERGAAALVGAAAAQWAVPVLVVSAAEPAGWLRPAAWSFALLGLAIGVRWIVVHQLQDASRDRLAGVSTYTADGGDVTVALVGAFAWELVLLGAGLALTWPGSALALIAVGIWLLHTSLLVFSRGSLVARLASYEDAPLAGYYFFGLPAAVAVGRLITVPASAGMAALLIALALPALLARLMRWRQARPVGPSHAQRA